ncbi:MAG: pilus assembly protein [Acidimicrobiales bacterium]|nr:pilus assembly protein [Acidimicrobiales bacterium]
MRDRHSSRGAIAAEFALILPILVLLLFAIIQLGLAFQRFEAVNAAAREGARVASLPSSDNADICNRVTSALAGTSFDGPPTCTPPPVLCSAPSAPDSVTVSVSVNNLIEIPFFGQQTVTLRGTGDFRCE